MDNAMKEERTHILFLTGSVLLALLIFAIDLNLPLGVVGGVPYIAVILLSMRSTSKRFTLIAAIACSALTIFGIYFSPAGGELWKVIVNRSLALFAIWITAVLCILEKIYKAKLVEAQKSLKTRSNAVLDNVIDGIITIDERGTIDSFNSAAERLFGYQASEVMGKNVNMLMPEPYHSEHDQYLKNYIESGVSKIIGIGREVVGLRKDGTTFPLDLGINEIYLGEKRMFTGIVHDTTERVMAESQLISTNNQLNKNREQLMATFVNAFDAIITIDEKGLIQSLNPSAERTFQYISSELLGKNIKILMPEPFRSEHDRYLTNYLESGVKKIIGLRREAMGLRKDGTTFPLDLGISELYLGETRIFTGIVRDITEQKEVEKKLGQTMHETQLILESVGEGIYGLDLDGKTTFVNPTAERILGYKEEDLLGKLQHALIHHSKPDGTPYPRQDCQIYAALKDGKSHRESEEVFWRKEGTPVPVEYVSTPIKENGKLTGAVVTFRDISERKRNERTVNEYSQSLKKAVNSLYKSNKELDDFAYIVSHDLKEPLRGIYNYSSFIKEDYFDKLDEEGKSKLDTLERLSKRMESLINTILYYARLGRNDLNVQPVNLNRVLEDVLDNIQALIKDSKVEVRIPAPLPVENCDETLMKDVYQNLIANAIKYNDKSDKWVEIGYTSNENGNGQDSPMEPGSEKSPGNPSSSPVFYVKDNGIGIHEKYFDSLFRIFKRLNVRKKFSDGTGAGTTIVKKIIERHHGKIWLESKEGEGTTFYFTLGGESEHEQHQIQPLDSSSGR